MFALLEGAVRIFSIFLSAGLSLGHINLKE